MANFEQKLTAASTEMFKGILEEMQNRKFTSVNFPLLLWGAVDTCEGESVYSALENYLFTLEDCVTPKEIEDTLSDMISDLEPDKKKKEEKSDNPEEGKSDAGTSAGNKEATASNTAESSTAQDTTDTSKEIATNPDGELKEQTSDATVEGLEGSLQNGDNANFEGIPEVISADQSFAETSEKNMDDESNAIEDESDEDVPDIVTLITLTDHEGKELVIPVDDNVCEVFEELSKIIEKFGIMEIEPLHIISAMFMTDDDDFIDFFCALSCNYDDAKKYFHPDRILVYGVIPFQLSGFLSTLNEKIDGKAPCEILCRDKEADILWNIMLKKNKRNAVIVGEPGVGKSALIEKLTYDINSGKCPPEFKKFKMIVLDVNALIAGTSYRGDAEERIKDLIQFLKDNHDVILFIDEVHTILGAGSCFEGEMDLANALKPILARGDTIVLGATTQEEYEKYFQRDGALSRRFEKVVVKEPLAHNVYPMIKNKIAILSDFHKVTISKDIVNYAVMIACCFAFEKKNPDKTLDLIDRAMVYAKRHGKKKVDKACILRTFDIFFEMWDKMSIDSRKEVAYHEAGHYIVGKASGRLTRYIWQAVSIMPAEDYLGVTVYEDDDTVVPFCSLDYYIDDLALHLGGRVAEKIFRKVYTSGASADLRSTTREANYIVSKLAMVSEDCPNRIYLNECDSPNYSEKVIDAINEEVDKLVKKAEDRATQILDENRDILEAIVEALLKHRIMSEADLDKVWKETVAKRTHK